MGDWLLRVENVSRSLRFRDASLTILAPVSFELSAGTVVALAGPSGSGKTTLCNIIIGWEPADSGRVEWASLEQREWARLAVAPQRLGLYEWLTVGENLVLPSWSMRRDTPEEALGRLGEQLQIGHLLNRRPLELSLGEQQRAAIARALLGDPALAVLDEPTGHQDEERTRLVVDELQASAARGTCVLVATHDPDVLDAADHIIHLERR